MVTIEKQMLGVGTTSGSAYTSSIVKGKAIPMIGSERLPSRGLTRQDSTVTLTRAYPSV
jgi:hypothetical protein